MKKKNNKNINKKKNKKKKTKIKPFSIIKLIKILTF